jgi:hypothetical protein
MDAIHNDDSMAGISSDAITRKWDFPFTLMAARFQRNSNPSLEIGGRKISLPEPRKWVLDIATSEAKI